MTYVHSDRPKALDPAPIVNSSQILDEAARGFSSEAIEQCRVAIDVASNDASNPYAIALLLYDLTKVFIDNASASAD